MGEPDAEVRSGESDLLVVAQDGDQGDLERNDQQGHHRGEEELPSREDHPGEPVRRRRGDEDRDDHGGDRHGEGVDERLREVVAAGAHRVAQRIDERVFGAAEHLAVVVKGEDPVLREGGPPPGGEDVVPRPERGDEEAQDRNEPDDDQDQKSRVDRDRRFSVVHLNTSCLANCLRLYHITGVTARTRTIAIAEPRP